MPITIPQRLQEKLHSDSTYEGYIRTLIRNTQNLITDKAAFFPEYTLHGWKHIQAVLHHADKLIPDVSMEQLTGKDAALLIAGVILHDLGMFLNETGVRKLLTGERSRTKNIRLADQEWKTAWDAYIHEIRRYPEEKLLYHFGMSGAIEEPDLTKTEFTDLERLIIGEFLRRHHHRIAHEIALTTMPGDTDLDVLQVHSDATGSVAFDTKDRKCIGILARSHGMAVRKTWDYISREIGSRYKEKLTYLMAVLRIADALDADEQRAPDTVRKLQGIRTPVSVKEWIWNQRIKRTDLDWNTGDDCKYVEVDPKSTTEFVHLEKWLESVQRELDLSWAIMSEACDTQKYRLSIHRIDSNILEEERRESYSEQFITKEARLNANPELLKLLVVPLYDNDPSCGVRELLQNAVDACNERAHLEGEGYRGQVEIRLDTAAKTLTVTDNGIGMDENVLLNYYLSAGASYRTSDEWFQNYATDRDPNIVRTGRFGVGVLATFLLGNTVEVTTRHMEDEFGYTFQFGLEPEPLDIKRPKAAPELGTTIRVTLKDDALEKLLKDYKEEKTWLNWYRFAEPTVRCWVNGDEYVSGKLPIPQDDREMTGWFKVEDAPYDAFYWGYPGEDCYCNGIRIPGGYGKCGYSEENTSEFKLLARLFRCPSEILPYPSLSIIDKNGKLKLDLSRKTVQDARLEQLRERELIRYTIAQVLAADWSSEEAAAERLLLGLWNQNDTEMNKDRKYVCSNQGYTILRPCFFAHGFTFPLLAFHAPYNVDPMKYVRSLRKLDPEFAFFLYPDNDNMNEYHSVLTHFGYARNNSNTPCIINNAASIAWIPQKMEHGTSLFSTFSYESYSCRTMQKDKKICLVLTRGTVPQSPPFKWDQWDQKLCSAISLRTVEVTKDMEQPDKLDLALHRALWGLIPPDDPWIPYKMEDRRKKFPKAFEELKYYIDRILADREKQ